MLTLHVYVTAGCWGCTEAERLVAELRLHFPQVAMALLDLNVVPAPPNVFATPTYVLNGRVIYLGNPRRADLQQTLLDALAQSDA